MRESGHNGLGGASGLGAAVAGAVCLLLVSAGPSSADIADDLARARKHLELLESKAALITTQYIDYRDTESERMRFEKRINDGQALMLLKDYVRAAIVFSRLLEDKRFEKHPGYAEALFNLAEALFFNKNYLEARQRYLQVLDHPYGGRYGRVALVRVMQIALNTGNFNEIDGVYRRLVGMGGATPEANYLWAKALLRQGNNAKAIEAFAKIPRGHSKFFQAAYLTGVALVKQGKLDDAYEVFRRLAKEPPQSEADRQIGQMAWLACGRILHDQGKIVEALDAYQAIPHTSPMFDQALEEIAWTYIRKAELAQDMETRTEAFREALRTLEILEVSTPDSQLVPRARLLKGYVLEKMQRFDEASKIFASIKDEFGKTKQQLDSLIQEHEDPVAYFNEMANRELEKFDLAAYVPPLAARWMSATENMAAAMGIMKDLEAGKRYLKESRALLAKLKELLNGAERINLFPALKEALKRVLEVENGRVILQRNLATIEERIISENLDRAKLKELERAKSERLRLERQIEKLPVTKRQFEKREATIRQRVEQLEKAVFEAGVALKGILAQLSAMRQWITANRDKFKGKEDALAAFMAEIERGENDAKALQQELDQLNQQLATEKARAGMDSHTLTQEETLRQRYEKALARERRLVESIQSRLGPEGSRQLEEVSRLRAGVEKLGRKIAGIKERLQKKVEDEARKLERVAREESENLDAFEAAMKKLERESENLLGRVAYDALRRVQQQFYQMVLKAEVGILDVAWGRKQSVTRKIGELGKKLGDERKQLYREFKDVLEQVD